MENSNTEHFSTTHKSTQTRIAGKSLEDEISALKQECENLRSRLKIMENKNDESFANRIKSLPPELARLVLNHLRNKNYDRHGWRYSNDYKKFCLSIYFVSPSAYNFIAKNINMPSKRTLFRYIKNWPSEPGFHETLFNSLKFKLQNLPDMAKNCLICMDEISLKTNLYFNKSSGQIIGLEDYGNYKTRLPANFALVVMARGITHHYTHLLGYFFVNSACSAKILKQIVLNCVKELIRVEMKPRLVISDQGGNFIGLNKLLGVSTASPYFYVQNLKIFYMYDTPHLLKSLWRNFIKYQITFDNAKNANWKDIKDFYLWDKDRQFKLAPKLSDGHIFPNNFQKMRVKFAAQTLSATVACGIYTSASIRATSSTAIDTAELIEKIDKLFDLFNSSKFKEAKRFRRPFFANAEQLAFLEEMTNFLENISFHENVNSVNKNVTKKIKFLKGWLQNISVLKLLYNELKADGVTFLLTRNLNQDCLENSFGVLRKRGGNTTLLSPFQFASAFKKSFSIKYMEDITTGNCEPSENLQLPDINLDLSKSSINLQASQSRYKFNISSDYKSMDFEEKNAFYYFCGWMLKKYRENHQCKLELISEPSSSSTYLEFKEYSYGNLLRPPKEYLDIVENLERKFSSHFNEICISNNIEFSLSEILLPYFSYNCCDRQDRVYFVRLYIRVRIYNILKSYNKRIKLYNNKNKLFSVMHL